MRTGLIALNFNGFGKQNFPEKNDGVKLTLALGYWRETNE